MFKQVLCNAHRSLGTLVWAPIGICVKAGKLHAHHLSHHARERKMNKHEASIAVRLQGACRMMVAFMAATKDNPSHRMAISSPLSMFARAPNLIAVGRLLNFNAQELNSIRSAPGVDLELLRRLSHEDKRWLILKGPCTVALRPFCLLSLCRVSTEHPRHDEAKDASLRSPMYIHLYSAGLHGVSTASKFRLLDALTAEDVAEARFQVFIL